MNKLMAYFRAYVYPRKGTKVRTYIRIMGREIPTPITGRFPMKTEGWVGIYGSMK